MLYEAQHPKYSNEMFPAFAGMRHVSWHPWPVNGSGATQVYCAAELVDARRSRFGIVRAAARVGGFSDPVCEADFLFSFLNETP